MIFQSFDSTETEAVDQLLARTRESGMNSIVFVFCGASRYSEAFDLQKRFRDDFPAAAVCMIAGGRVANNGNPYPEDAVTVTVMAGQFRHEVRILDGQPSEERSSQDLSGILLFGFGNTNPEEDLRRCESSNPNVPIVGGSFRGSEIIGMVNGETLENRGFAIFCYGDIVFQTKAFSDVFPIGNSFVIGKTDRMTTTKSLRWLSALKYFGTTFGESYVQMVLSGKTLIFPLLVKRNGMFAPRTIIGADFSNQDVVWSGSVLEGEEAYLGMHSSDQIASSVKSCMSFALDTPHEGGFVFSDLSRYELLGEKSAWNFKPDKRRGLMGLFGDSAFTPFHGTNECLSQTLAILLISDSSTKTVPNYAVRGAEGANFENLMLNSLNFLRSALQVQIMQNTRETMKLNEAIQAGNDKIDYLQNSQQDDLIRIIDDAPVAIWMGDADERTVFANSRFAELVGYSKEEMQGMESFDFWEPESIKTVQNNNEIRIKGEKSTYEACLLSKNKEVIPVRLTGIPISTGTVGMMLDLRELRKEELQRAALQQLSDSKDSFLNIASHELRTPITSILGYISMLIDGDYEKLPDPAIQALTVVQSSGKRLFNIINHMLQLAKLESGHTVLQETPISLSEICKSIMSEVYAIALERQIKMDFKETWLKEPPIIIGDPDQVRKAILNLVGNSLKFTQWGGSVDMEIFRDGNEMVLSVTDTGVGIPEKDHIKVFEKFAQSENAMTRTYEGTGLGLAFVKEIITKMNGRIDLESEVGKGSKFSIHFTKLPV